ncbi:hypothetical protein TURU_037327 [Turdus rufiventris]|nr:hypothetical protein TURU_037327 [Turdus rufiventris]
MTPSCAVSGLEGRDVIQQDLDKLEKWICEGIMKFYKAKCKVLNLPGAIPITSGVWAESGVRAVPRKRHSIQISSHYKVIKEAVSHSSTGNLQEIKAAFQNSPRTQETASKERKMTESKCHQAKVADIDPCS